MIIIRKISTSYLLTINECFDLFENRYELEFMVAVEYKK